MLVRSFVVPLLLCAPMLAQTAQETTPPPAQTSSRSAQALPDAPGTPAQAAVPTGPTAVIDTTMGRLTCKLYQQQAPVAVANFVGLAEGTKDYTDPVTGKKVHGKPFYNGTTFHRVIPEFMIQGGDPRGDGTGDPGYYFNDEIDPSLTFNVPGRLAMANSGPNTNGSQFYITESPQPSLDGKYTIFGQCDAHSILTEQTIARVQRNANDKPLTPVVINKITIVREGQPMPADPMPPAAAPGGSAPASGSPAAPPASK